MSGKVSSKTSGCHPCFAIRIASNRYPRPWALFIGCTRYPRPWALFIGCTFRSTKKKKTFVGVKYKSSLKDNKKKSQKNNRAPLSKHLSMLGEFLVGLFLKSDWAGGQAQEFLKEGRKPPQKYWSTSYCSICPCRAPCLVGLYLMRGSVAWCARTGLGRVLRYG